MFDSGMSMKAHASSINMSAYPQVKNVRAIKPFLHADVANTATHAFVSSHLDAEHTILYGITQCQLQCIQRTHNNAARIATDKDNMHILPQSFISVSGCPYMGRLSSRYYI